MENAHISSPSHNCGSELLPNANCISSEEGGKKTKPNQTTHQKPPPNFEQLLSDSFPPLTPLQNQDHIIEQVFQLSTPATTEIIYTRKIWWGALRTAANLSERIHIQIHGKSNTRFTSREKKNTSQNCGNSPLAYCRVEIVHAPLKRVLTRCRQSGPGSAANAAENPEEESCPAASSGNHNHPSLPGSLYSKCQLQKTCFSPLWPLLSLLVSRRRWRGGKRGRALPWGRSQPPSSSAVSGFAAAG